MHSLIAMNRRRRSRTSVRRCGTKATASPPQRRPPARARPSPRCSPALGQEAAARRRCCDALRPARGERRPSAPEADAASQDPVFGSCASTRIRGSRRLPATAPTPWRRTTHLHAPRPLTARRSQRRRWPAPILARLFAGRRAARSLLLGRPLYAAVPPDATWTTAANSRRTA